MTTEAALLVLAITALNIILDISRGDLLATWCTCVWLAGTVLYGDLTRHRS